MAGGNTGRLLDVRPAITRARSSTTPTTIRGETQENTALSPPRPGHTRSRSYISPVEVKPTPAATFPASTSSEKPVEASRFSRLHLPGKHHHNHSHSEDTKSTHHHKKHRYTQSEAQQYQKRHERDKNERTPTITTTAPNDQGGELYPSSRGAPIPSLMRMGSFRSYRGPPPGGDPASLFYGPVQPAYRRRTNSDPKSPTQDPRLSDRQPRPRSSIEFQLQRADRLRRAAHKNVSKSDVDKLNTELSHANSELAERLASTSRTASDLMRRLDDAHDTLHRTAESMVDTISSFTNLSHQSAKLISNFDKEIKNLDDSTRKRIEKYRTDTANKRTRRIEELEAKGNALSAKAEELGRRLENCRTIIINWEEREISKRKAWKGVWNGLLWGFLLITIGILAGVASWKIAEVSYRGNSTSQSRVSSASEFEGSNVPDDVRTILDDIAARKHNHTALKVGVGDKVVESTYKDDRRLRLLDEL